MVLSKNLKKIIGGLLLGLVMIVGLEFYGKKIVVMLSDNIQKNICTESFCIKIPKDWIPYVVKRSNDYYFFNFIKNSWIPWEQFIAPRIKKSKNGIVLEKNSQYITIYHDQMKPNILKSLKKLHFGKNTCYLVELDNLVLTHCKDINISIIMDKSIFRNEDILNNIFGTLPKDRE